MTQQKKFELGKSFGEPRKLFQRRTRKTLAERVKQLMSAPSKDISIRSNRRTVEGQFVEDKDSMDLEHFELQQISNLEQNLQGLNNPQSTFTAKIKLDAQMPTMIGQMLQESNSEDTTVNKFEQHEEIKKDSPFVSIQGNNKPFEQFYFTPQKLKRPLTFQEMENSEQYRHLFWAPRRKIKRSDIQQST